jgi:hypothetical protein
MSDKINRRLGELEEQAREDGEAPSDLIITALTEQHERGPDGTLIAVKREPIGYSEITWRTSPTGARIGNRYALYDGQVSNWAEDETGN